ncbi:MAG: hypothetical protein J6386_11770 [Candidatus Synoicihabitans palmerolidicus]|nr:hypothetical protein [Candidatus Synoicihabitans palmerolidicus]
MVGQLFDVADGVSTPVFSDQIITTDDSLTATTPFSDDTLLVDTYGRGLQLFNATSLTPFSTESIFNRTSRFISIHATMDDRFVAAIEGYGVVYFDRQGHVIDVLDRTRDPRISRIRHLLPTENGVFWVLLPDGIARVPLPAPLTSFEFLLSAGIDYASVHRLDENLWLVADGKLLRGHYDRDDRLIDFVEDSPPDSTVYSISTDTGLLITGPFRAFSIEPRIPGSASVPTSLTSD